MMYSGRGWVALLVFILAFGGALVGADSLMHEQNAFRNHPGLQFGAWGVAAAIVFVLGRVWNAEPPSDVIGRDGRQVTRERPRHTIYRIPMEWWGPIFFVLFSALSIKMMLKK